MVFDQIGFSYFLKGRGRAPSSSSHYYPPTSGPRLFCFTSPVRRGPFLYLILGSWRVLMCYYYSMGGVQVASSSGLCGWNGRWVYTNPLFCSCSHAPGTMASFTWPKAELRVQLTQGVPGHSSVSYVRAQRWWCWCWWLLDM